MSRSRVGTALGHLRPCFRRGLPQCSVFPPGGSTDGSARARFSDRAGRGWSRSKSEPRRNRCARSL